MRDLQEQIAEGRKRYGTLENISSDAKRAIEQILTNDEASSDAELIRHFIKEMGLADSEARQWVARRNDYLRSYP